MRVPRLARNIAFNIIGQAIALVAGLLAVRLVFHGLGGDEVGLIFLATTIGAALAATLDLGISSTVVRSIASSGNVGLNGNVGLIRTAALIYWAVYGLLVLTIVGSAPTIVARWLTLGNLAPDIAASSLKVLAAGVLLSIPRSLYAGVFRGLQWMGTVNILDVAGIVVQNTGIVVVVALGGDLQSVSAWILLSSALWVLAYVIWLRRAVPTSLFLLPGWDYQAIRANRSFAAQVALISILAMVNSQADKLIVSRLLPLAAFGLYAVAYSSLARGMLLTSAITQAAYPSFAQLAMSRDREGLLNQYRRLQDLLCYGVLPLFAAVPFFVRPVFAFLFESQAATTLLVPCTLLAVGFYMNSTLNLPHVLLLATGRPQIATALNAWAMVSVLPATAYLVWKLGMTGAAASWVLYHCFAYAYAVPRVSRECGDGETLGWYLNVAKFAGPGLLIYGLAWSIAEFAGARGAAGSGLAYGAATAAYAAIGWLALPRQTRQLLRAQRLGLLI